MSDRHLLSDPHFGHGNTFEKFKCYDGLPLRPFKTVEEMNETMINNINAKCAKKDTLYMLGDIVINKKYLEVLKEINCRIVLVPGNHDIYDIEEYLKYFDKIYPYRIFVDEFIFSHIPLHPDCVTDRFKVNVHGHLHANVLRDPKYVNVSVEQTNYAPLSFDELKARIKRFKESGVYNYALKYRWDHFEKDPYTYDLTLLKGHEDYGHSDWGYSIHFPYFEETIFVPSWTFKAQDEAEAAALLHIERYKQSGIAGVY